MDKDDSEALSALMTVLEDVARWHYREPQSAGVEAALALVDNIDCTLAREDRPGLGPIHEAAIHADVRTVELVLAKAKEPSLPLSDSGRIDVPEGIAPRTYDDPRVGYQAGMTALDLIDVIVAFLEKQSAAFAGDKRDNSRALREWRIEQLTANRAALVGAGVTKGKEGANTKRTQAAKVKAPDKVSLDRSFATLAKLAGVKIDDMEGILEDVDSREDGAWAYFRGAIDALPALRTPTLAKMLKGSHLHRFLMKNAFAGGKMPTVDYVPDAESEVDDCRPLDPDDYPEEARSGLREGVIVGATGATVILLWPKKKGTPPSRVCVASPKTFSILAESVEDFVASEVALLVKGNRVKARPRT